MRILPLLAFVTLLASSFAVRSVNAAQIDWNNLFGGTQLTSKGDELDDTYMFELGAFANGFVPSAANKSQWVENWVALDRAIYLPGLGFFGGSGSVTSNDAPFALDAPGYIWGFSCSSGVGEWVLFKNTARWKWPFAQSGVGFPSSWTLADPGTTAVIGTLSGGGTDFSTANVGTLNPPGIRGDAWRDQHFTASELTNPDVSDWDADPDLDGCANLLELAAGTNPRTAGSRPVIESRVVGTTGNVFHELRLVRTCQANVDIAAEESFDLLNWSAATVTTVRNNSDELVLRSVNPVASGARKFLRFALALP